MPNQQTAILEKSFFQANPHLPFIQKISVSSEENFCSVNAFFIGRIPGLMLPADRQEALLLQKPLHRKIVATLFPPGLTRIFHTDRDEEAAKPGGARQANILTQGCMSTYCPSQNVSLTQHPSVFPDSAVDQQEISGLRRLPLVYADQCHGADIALIKPPFQETQEIDRVDGLMTAHSGVILGIRTADCAPVWIIEKQGRAGALIHSGKKGTEAGIVPKAILKMQEAFQVHPKDLIVTIGPCIRPPYYEVDFAKMIREQAAKAGVGLIQDEKICTASHLDRYYSYRREHGKTGHMLALLLLRNNVMSISLSQASAESV